MFSVGTMNRRSVLIITFLASLFLGGTLGAQSFPSPGGPQYTVRQTATGLTVAFSFDELAITEPGGQMTGGKLVQIPGIPMNFEPGRPLLPVVVLPVALPKCDAEVQIQLEDVVEYDGIEPVYFTEAQNLPGKETQYRAHSTEKPDLSVAGGQIMNSPRIADLAELGYFRDYLLSRLRVFPVQVTNAGMRFFKKFTVNITYHQLQPVANAVSPEDAAILRRLVINDRQLHLIGSQPAVPGRSGGGPADGFRKAALPGSENEAPAAGAAESFADPARRGRWLRNPGNVAEYLIITHPRLWKQAEMLKTHRERQGTVAVLVDVQDIYDEFNYGIKSPLAIKHFLKYAFYHWERKPRLKYVLLFGDAEFTETLPGNADCVPTFIMKSPQGAVAATDLPYALVSGDDAIPDLFIGRIPASSPDEARAAVQKIIEYETNGAVGSWRNQALFVNGGDWPAVELAGGSPVENGGTAVPRFRDTGFFTSWLPAQVSVLWLDAIQDPALLLDPNRGTNADLMSLWNNGVCLINFLGNSHGTGRAENGLLTPADVDRLHNKGMYPFVVGISGGAGAYASSSRPGMAEKLVLAAERGAIGVITAVVRRNLRKNFVLPGQIGRFLFDRECTVGEALMLGKICFSANHNNETREAVNFTNGELDNVLHEEIYQYNLIGDPMIRLPFVADELPIALNSDIVQRGDTLEVTVQPPGVPASGYVELADRNFNIVNRFPLFDVTSSSSVKFPIGANFPPGDGVVRAYLSDGARDFSSSANFVVNQATITAFELHPPRPRADDTVWVHLHIRERHGIGSVRLLPQGVSEGIPAIPDLQAPHRFTVRLAPSYQSGRVSFDVVVENKLGKFSVIPGFSFQIRDYRPDITPVSGSLRLTGIKKVALTLRLSNAAGAGVNGTVKVKVHFAHHREDLAHGNFFATAVGQIGANDSVDVNVAYPFPLTTAPLEIFALARVDPSENVADFNSANDTLHTVLQPDIFTVFPDKDLEISMPDGRYQVKFPGGCLSDTAAVQIRIIGFEPPGDQPALLPVPLTATDHFHALEVKVLNPAARLRLPFEIRVGPNPALFDTSKISFSNITLFGKSDLTQPWISTHFSIDPSTGEINAALQQDGLFAPFVSSDHLPPKIELSVDGKTLSHQGAISYHSTIHLQLQDEGGLNLQREKIRVTIDGMLLPENRMIMSSVFQSNDRLEMTLFPELSPGTHQVQVETEDINGNAVKREFELTAAQQMFDVIVYGNYPNPFSDRTIFAYFVQVADELDDFEIRIYTVNGQLIRRINADINNAIDAPDGGAKRKGYNEIIWDGTDNNGNLVANGLYFAIIRAVYQGDTIEKILKVAKLR